MKLRATKARGLGQQYVQLLWGFTGPTRETGWTNEVAAPYRYGQCTVTRLWPLPCAIVLGTWQGRRATPAQLKHVLTLVDPDTEDPADMDLLLCALEGRWCEERDLENATEE
jgi:hypothetical protein